jgi:hypothetical protein
MKKTFVIRTKKEIRNPTLLRGALEGMGYLLERSENGTFNSSGDQFFDLKIEDRKGHGVRGVHLNFQVSGFFQ